MSKLSFLISIAFILILLQACGEKMTERKEDNTVPALSPANMDLKIKPGDDFYRFANGTWIRNNPVPAEETRWGAFNEVQDRNYDALKKMFEKTAGENAAKGSIAQKIGDFYASGMDSSAIEKAGMTPLNTELDKINNIKDKKDVVDILSDFNSSGIFPFFYVYSGQDDKNSEMVIAQIRQGGLGLPDRDYYLNDDDRSVEIRKEYLKHLKAMFMLMGEDENASAQDAETVMTLETSIANISRSRVDLRDPNKNYNKFNIKGLAELNSIFNWRDYFHSIGLDPDVDINVGQPEFIKGIGDLVKNEPVDEWKVYLRWNLINSMASYLSSDFVTQNFKFYGQILSGQKELRPRWKRVLQTTSNGLGEIVGKLYVEKYFPPEAKKRMIGLVKNLRLAFADRIKNLDWMSEETKKQALNKLEKINTKIGYPDKWIDYSSLDIGRDCYVCNVLNARRFNFKYNMDKIGKPVDRGEWHMNPQTVNAYYNPTMNEIVFPAAILQPPFFNLHADDAVNYGAIGAVIGHEMTHGFDDQGRQYAANGNLEDWWTKEDAERFNKKAEVVVNEYNGFQVIDTMHINGKMTLGENIADIGGITIAFDAMKKALAGKENEKIDGYTPEQRFFLSFAQVWRNTIRDEELMRRLKVDVHSPAEYRVNGVLPNIDTFYKAFDIKTGDKLYLPEKDRAKIW